MSVPLSIRNARPGWPTSDSMMKAPASYLRHDPAAFLSSGGAGVGVAVGVAVAVGVGLFLLLFAASAPGPGASAAIASATPAARKSPSNLMRGE